MTDERRERYAVSIAKIDCGRWGIAVPDKGHEFWHMWRALADAAMAVADAEIAQVNDNLKAVLDGQAADNARLRAELAEMAQNYEQMEASFYEQG